jgi:iron(III) transport system permease protein
MLMTLVPIIFLLMGTFMKYYSFFEGVRDGPWTLGHWTTILNDSVFLRSVRNTLVMAFGAATMSVVFFTLLAYMIVRSRMRLRGFADVLTWIPQALPGVIMALAWVWILLQTPFLRPIYGTIFALILVSGLSGITLGVQIVKANLLQLGSELEEASYITGANWVTTLVRVVLPLLAPSMAVVWVINFVNAAGSAILPAFLATPQSRPLALLQLEHVMSGQNEEASIVGVLVVLMTVGVAIAARTLGFRVGLGRT